MKTINKLFLFILLASLSLVSCNQNDFDTPPIEVPHYTGAPANMTIKELKAAHATAIAGNTADLIAKGSNIIISGVITGNDKNSNIYKKIVIQDETGAIDIAINQTNLYTTYAVGQKVFLKCDSLYIGGYGGQAQIGWLYKSGVGQMTQSTFESKIALDGLPVKENLPTVKEITFEDLSKPGSEDLKGTLVMFKDVHFEKTGDAIKDVFASGSTNEEMSRNIVLSTGQKLLMRTSSYASFGKDALPKGTGNVIVILGSFNGTWQLTLRSVSDLIDFKGEDPIAPVVPGGDAGSKAKPYDMAGVKASQGKTGWTKGYIVGGVKSMVLATGAVFEAPFTGTATNLLIAASPTEKNTANCIAIALPTGAIRDALNLEAHPENLGKELLFYGFLDNYFGAPGVINTSAAYLAGGALIGLEPIDVTNALFTETFGASIGSFKAEAVLGTPTWVFDAKIKCMKMSGQVNKANADAENWMISPAIDLSKVTKAVLTFEHAINFTGNSADARKTSCQVFVSTNYSSGAPNSATWTELVIPAYPTSDSWTFVNAGNIDLPVGSNSVRVAFKYKSTTTVCPVWEIKNFVVK